MGAQLMLRDTNSSLVHIEGREDVQSSHILAPPESGTSAWTSRCGVLHFQSSSGFLQFPPDCHIVTILLSPARNLSVTLGHSGVKSSDMPSGTIVMAPAGVKCDIQWSFPCEGIVVSFAREAIDDIAHSEIGQPSWGLTTGLAAASDLEALSLAKRLRDELLRQAGANKLLLEGLTTVLGVHLLRNYNPNRTILRRCLSPVVASRVEEYLRQHFLRTISVAELAALAGLSVGRFIKLFSGTFGQSPHQYMLDLRLDRAEELLSHSDITVAEAAYLSGFSNQSHLTTTMRKRRCYTPAEVRRSHQARHFRADKLIAQNDAATPQVGGPS